VRKLTKKEAWSKLGLWIRTATQLHEVFHGFQFPCCSICPVLCPSVAPTFFKN
jgi:hypothetical protein